MICPFVYWGRSFGKRNNWKKEREEAVEKTPPLTNTFAFLCAHEISTISKNSPKQTPNQFINSTGHELIKTVHPRPTLSQAIMEATAYGEVIHQ